MALRDIGRRLDQLEALTESTDRAHYIWRQTGETAEQAIERGGMLGRNVVVIGWEEPAKDRAACSRALRVA
jgi:hypothetical protein